MAPSNSVQPDLAYRSGARGSLQSAREITGVSVVVPLFNEREGATQLLETLTDLDFRYRDQYGFEFLLVDDGSRDGTTELLENAVTDLPNFRLIRHETNRGIAAAIHTGLLHAQNEIVASIDSDGSYEADTLAQMIPLLREDIDLVTASPYHPQGRVQDVPAWRLSVSRAASLVYRTAMRRKLYCYTSCCRVYRRSRFLELRTQAEGFVGVAELIWKAETENLTIVEHPTVLRTRNLGHSKMKVVRSALAHLHLVSRIACSRIISRRSPRRYDH